MDKFTSLGIIVRKKIPGKPKIEELLASIESVFTQSETTEEDIVRIIKSYLPIFEHIETGKSLDSKM